MPLPNQFCEKFYEGQKAGLDGTPLLPMFCPSTDSSNLAEMIMEHNEWFKEKLDQCGAILFRGWNLNNAQDFAAVVDSFGFKNMPYVQGEAKREHVYGPVATANATPLDQEIGFHSEMAYLAPHYPDVVMFFCDIPPGEGGATSFVPGDVAYTKLIEKMPEFVSKLEEHGILYIYSPQKGWQVTLDTTDKAVAEERVKSFNARLEWNDETGDAIFIRGPFPPTHVHPTKGVITWFNSLGVFSKKNQRMAYGDGTPITQHEVQESLGILKAEQYALQWHKGDVVVVDNHGVMHCRLPGRPPRRILVALGTKTNEGSIIMVCDLKNDKHAQRWLAAEREVEKERKRAAAAAKRAENAAAKKKAREAAAAKRQAKKEAKEKEKQQAEQEKTAVETIENNPSVEENNPSVEAEADPSVEAEAEADPSAVAAQVKRKSPRLQAKEKLNQVTKTVETKKSKSKRKTK